MRDLVEGGGRTDDWALWLYTKKVPVAEGNVGGGTGMTVYGLKGGIGTASRVLDESDGGWNVGVLVQANHGTLEQLTVAGVPVGRHLAEDRSRRAAARAQGPLRTSRSGDGSIIIVVATDAPLAPTHLKRIARRGPERRDPP